MLIHDSFNTWLKKQLTTYIDQDCYCVDGIKPGLRGNFPPGIVCTECLKHVGIIPSDAWPQMEFKIKAQINYLEATTALRLMLRNHRNWRCYMTTGQATTEIPDARIIKTIPGHIIFDSADAAAVGDNCMHIWILDQNKQARCIHCEGTRVLDEEEVALIEAAEAAGITFLKWPERFEMMNKARGSTRRGRRKSKRTKRPPGTPRGITNVQAEVPKTHVPIKVAAQTLGIGPKKLRKMVRSDPDRYEAIKVGRLVHIKIPKE